MLVVCKLLVKDFYKRSSSKNMRRDETRYFCPNSNCTITNAYQIYQEKTKKSPKNEKVRIGTKKWSNKIDVSTRTMSHHYLILCKIVSNWLFDHEKKVQRGSFRKMLRWPCKKCTWKCDYQGAYFRPKLTLVIKYFLTYQLV